MIQPGFQSENVTVVLNSSLSEDQTLWVIADPEKEEVILDSAVISVANVTRSPAALAPAPDPPTDPDGDGRFEDIDGSGTFDVIDVARSLDLFEQELVTSQSRFFEFNGDGRINVIDVATLLTAT